MRLHVTYQGKKTTISVDDQLIDYLGAWLVEKLPQYHGNAQKQYEKAKAHIRKYVDLSARTGKLPATNISQYIQAFIIEEIAEPYIADILKARGPRHKSKPNRRPSKVEADPAIVDQAMDSLAAMLGKKLP